MQASAMATQVRALHSFTCSSSTTVQQQVVEPPHLLRSWPLDSSTFAEEMLLYTSCSIDVAAHALLAALNTQYCRGAQVSIQPTEVLHDTSRSCPATSSTTAGASNSSEISSSCYGVDNLACLPSDLLAQVLSLLPLADRLRSCAVACRALQAAAFEASSGLVVRVLTKQQHADAFAAWIAKPANGSALLQLNVNCGILELLLLPAYKHQVTPVSIAMPWRNFGQLQSLQLVYMVLQPGGVSTQQQESPASGVADPNSDSGGASDNSITAAGALAQSSSSSSSSAAAVTAGSDNSGGAFDLNSLLGPLAVNSSSTAGDANSNSNSRNLTSLPAPVIGSSGHSSSSGSGSGTFGAATSNSSSRGLGSLPAPVIIGSSSSSSSNNPLTALTSLQRLSLRHCDPAPCFGLGFSQLTALSALQQLTLLNPLLDKQEAAESAEEADNPHLSALVGTLVHLLQLSELSLGGWYDSHMGAAVAAGLSSLTRLQRLELQYVGERFGGLMKPADPVLLRMLPVSLTALQCTSCCIQGDEPEVLRLQPEEERLLQFWLPGRLNSQLAEPQQLGLGGTLSSSSTEPQQLGLGGTLSAQFNALRRLQLQDTDFIAKLLLQMPQLYSLSIAYGSRELRSEFILPSKDIPMRALLAQLCDVLPQLQQLRELSLFGIMPRPPKWDDAHGQQAFGVPALQQPAVDGAAGCVNYAGLTASSRLTCLRIESCSMTEGATATAAAALQQVFGAGQQLPHLQTVLLAASPLPELEVLEGCYDRDPQDYGYCIGLQDLREEDVASMPKHSLVLSPGDAARIVQCCPNLRSLGAVLVGKGLTAAELAPLLLLTQLPCLGIAGEGCDDAVAGQVLA
jgi:hypothetical protein